jgi:DNA-binding CsgD family transcriptional regulator
MTLTARERRLVREMGNNERTMDLSKRFDLSPARISQLRRELHIAWTRFGGNES